MVQFSVASVAQLYGVLQFDMWTISLLILLVGVTIQYSPDLSLYKSIPAIHSELQSLHRTHPHLIRVHKCRQDKDIWYASLGDPNSPAKAFVTCGVHARELITSDTCMDIIKTVIREQKKFHNLFLVVMPVVNKNRAEVLDGDLCLRVNENGVDPNRNFPTDFRNGDSKNGTDTYHGPHALSQKSSQCIDQILSHNRWNLFVDIHTGEFSIFYSQPPGNPRNSKTQEIARNIKHKQCPNCLVTTLKEQKRQISGQMFEYAGHKYGVDHSMLFEMFGGKMSKRLVGQDSACMKEFNPNSIRIRDYYIHKWTQIVTDVLAQVIALNDNKEMD